MRRSAVRSWTVIILVVLALGTPARVAAREGLARIVVFGTSLSDPGNAFALYGGTNNPPYDTLDPFLVPNCDDQLAAILSEQFNSNLDALLASLGLPGIEITRLDVFAILNDVVADLEHSA